MIDPVNLPKLDFLPPAPKIITPWGNNGFGEITYLGHYARDVEELGRREHWPETIERVIRGTGMINAGLTSKEEYLLREHMLRLRGTVSGRALYTLGTPLVEMYGMDSLVNCVSWETKVLTAEGLKIIRDLAGTTPTLMTEDGSWVEAPVKSFGVQPVMIIHLQRDSCQKIIRATPEHGWFIRSSASGSPSLKRTTKELKPGDHLVSVVGPGQPPVTDWEVLQVTDPQIKEEVFCAIVPRTHSFVLEHEILTSNCWFTTITQPEDFSWLMARLMVGGGVGFSVERANIYKFHKVVGANIVHENTFDTDFIVPDTRRGWSDFIGRVIAAHFTGESFSYSTKAIRSAGTPLKTFGGKASGPNALIEGVEDICKIMCARVGKQLRSVDILDIANIIGGIVVAGSSRRSAEIAIGDPDDALFITAKRWAKGTIPAWRANSNNTIIVDNFEEIADDAPFWRNYDGGSEPYGLFNRRLARTMGRLGEKKPDPSVEGVNPCFAADTRILTAEGWRTFRELAGQNPLIVQDLRVQGQLDTAGREQWLVDPVENGTVVNQAANVRITARQQQLYRLTTADGRSVRATADHHFATPEGMVTLDKLKVGQSLLVALPDPYVAKRDSQDWSLGYSLGLVASEIYLDEAAQRAQIAIWDTTGILDKTVGLPGWSKQDFTWIHVQSRDFKSGFISGLLYGNGSIQDVKGSINWRLAQPNQKFLSDIQLVLQELGVLAKLLLRHATHQTSMPDDGDSRAPDDSKAYYELIISGRRQCERAAIVLEIPSHQRARWEALRAHYQKSTDRDSDATTVVSVESDTIEDVWCLSEDTRRTLIAEGLTARRCGESVLSNRESCNLATIWLPNVEGFDQFTEISKILYKIQKATALLPHPDPVTEAIVHKNLRLGQNVTGIFQANQEQRDWMNPGYEVLRSFDKEWSRKLGVNESIRLTTVQPGGCRPWDALTTTDAGILTLQEIFVDHEDDREWSPVKNLKVVQDDGKQVSISQSYINGKAETLHIKLNYGFELVSTYQHPWWVQERIDRSKDVRHQKVEKWVVSQDLRVGDVLKLTPGVYNKQEHTQLQQIKTTAIRMRSDGQHITQPKALTPDLAWLLGYLWGDGSQSPHRWRIRFTDERLENLEKATRIIREVFGLETTLRLKSERCYELTAASIELWHFLIANHIWKYTDDNQIEIIPEVVRRSSREDIIAFIAGLLDSDGWAGIQKANDYAHITISTADHDFASHLQHVALAAGLVFGRGEQYYSKPGPRTHLGKKSMTNLVLTSHSLPESVALLATHSNKFIKISDRNLTPAHGILGKITEISEGKEVPTFDIEVTNNHWYYAGGIKSHNTLSNLPGVTSGVHAAWAEYYVRRARFGSNDSIIELCRQRGYPILPEVGLDGNPNHTRLVVEFPCKAPANTPLASEDSALTQLDRLTWAQRNWSDQAVSVTITYKPEELPEIRRWLAEHYDHEVKSVSFLLYSGHGFALAPYEKISKEEYERRASKIKVHEEIDLHGESIIDDTDCAGGSCPVR